MSFTRVREALSDSDFCRKLRGKLPTGCVKLPEELVGKISYPTVLLKAFPKGDEYTSLGVVTEALLRCEEISTNTLRSVCLEEIFIEIPDKVLTVQSTINFINKVKSTREKLIQIFQGEPEYEPQIRLEDCPIEGHPDIVCGTDIFEIKTSGKLKASWVQFLLQVFCYAALYPSAKKIHLVLPLSETIWSFTLSGQFSNVDLKPRCAIIYKIKNDFKIIIIFKFNGNYKNVGKKEFSIFCNSR